MKPRKIGIIVKSLVEESLLKKFGIAFIFMSLMPIVLLLFIVHVLGVKPLLEDQLPYFSVTMFLVVALSVVCFIFIRKSLKTLKQFTSHAEEIASGSFHKRIDTSERDELGILAQSFNTITAELETKIKELQTSKQLLLNILQKVGTAVTSTKGISNLLELILQTVIKGADGTSGAIFLFDETGEKMEVKVSSGISKEAEGLIVKAGEGLIGRVARLQKTEVVSGADTNIASYFEYHSKLTNTSIIAAPLIYKDKVLGVITISDKKGKDSFTKDDIVLIENVALQTAVAIANYQLNEDAEKTYLETITALAVAIEARDHYSRGHLDRVAEYATKVGKAMGLDDEMLKVLRNGAILHDIGKIGVRDEVLKKTGALTHEEEKEMRDHVIIGVNIIRPIKSMAALCDLIRYHQEFYDGTGYPEGLKGEEIPLTARILKVCDAYDAMTTDRPYHKALSREEAREELKRMSAKQFDPKIAEIFLKAI